MVLSYLMSNQRRSQRKFSNRVMPDDLLRLVIYFASEQ
ncbi:hypothetical protein CZ794_03745 [Psychrobacter sp. JB385]|nr:hypothetical protein CZ794_03745 [Psychrobacter sp. JB385]